MSGVVTAVVASAAIGAGVSASSAHQARKAAKSASGRLDALQYLEDPDFVESQEKLKGLGLGLVEGDIPDYYKAIGETGSQEFEDMLGMTTRDIKLAAAESAAAKGTLRGGNIDAITAQSVADKAIEARYEDYNRALSGKQYLLGTGINTLEGVRSAAFGEQTERNALEASKAGAMIDLDFYKADQKSQEVAGYGSAAQSVLSLWSPGGALSSVANQQTTTTTDEATNKRKAAGIGSLGTIAASLNKRQA